MVGRIPFSNYSNSVGLGYVILPENFKGKRRDTYIENCYRKERIAILIEGGGFKTDCYITHDALSRVRFPKKAVSEKKGDVDDVLGSAVVFLPEPYHDHPIILGVISKGGETNLFKENEYKVLRTGKGSFALLTVNGDNGSVNITAYGESDNTGNLNINVSNKNKKASINVNVKGSVNMQVTDQININCTNNVNVITGKDVDLSVGGKVVVNDAEEVVALGNKSEEVFNNVLGVVQGIISAISQYASVQSVVTANPPFTPLTGGYTGLTAGMVGLLNELNILKSKIHLIKSKMVYTD